MAIRNQDHCSASCPKTLHSFKALLERFKPNRICRTDTRRLVEWDSQNSKNHEFMMQIFCQSPLFYLWLPSSLCLLLTLKLLHIHVWFFFSETRGAPLDMVLFEVSTASLVKLSKSRQIAQSSAAATQSFPKHCHLQLRAAQPGQQQQLPLMISLVSLTARPEMRHLTATTIKLCDCVCSTKCFHAQNLITDRNSQVGQPHRQLSCFQCHDSGRKYLIVLYNHWQWLIKLGYSCCNRKDSSRQLTLSSFFSLTSYLCGRNLGGTHFLSSFFNEVGSFRGDLRALSSDKRRGDTVLLLQFKKKKKKVKKSTPPLDGAPYFSLSVQCSVKPKH